MPEKMRLLQQMALDFPDEMIREVVLDGFEDIAATKDLEVDETTLQEIERTEMGFDYSDPELPKAYPIHMLPPGTEVTHLMLRFEAMTK